MPPVLNTYGVKKKKRCRLPKFIFEECSETDDVFESLNIENIKETKALLEEKGKLKSKKRETVRKPFYSLGCSNDADSTFDRLLKEGPTRRFSSPLRSSDSSSSSNDSDSSDFLSLPKKRTCVGKSKSVKTLKTHVKKKTASKGSPINSRVRVRKPSKKTTDDTFFTKLDKDVKAIKQKMEDSFFAVKDISMKANAQTENIAFGSNVDTTPILPKVAKKYLEISPILPINLTSTPQGNMTRKQFNFSPSYRISNCDVALVPNESVRDKTDRKSQNSSVDMFASDRKSVNFSQDMFASFEFQVNKDTRNSNDHALSVVDLCSSIEQVDDGLNVCQSSHTECDTNHSRNCLHSSRDECDLSKCARPLLRESDAEVSLMTLDHCRERTRTSVNVSEVDITGSVDDTDRSSLGPNIQDEELTSFQRSSEEVEVNYSNSSDPSIRDCVVMLSNCDLTEKLGSGVNASVMDSISTQDTVDERNLSEKSSVHSDSTPSYQTLSKVLPLMACEVVLHRCDAELQAFEPQHSVKSALCDSSFCAELESCEAEDQNASTHCAKELHKNDKPKNDPRVPCECKVLLFRCDDSALNPIDLVPVPITEHSPGVKADPSCSLTQENNCESLDSLMCVRPSLSMKHSATPESVVLKPGKHWRRSLSILSKIRTSLGEPGSRKSLAFNEGATKGKLWESSVNSLIQLQSNKEALVEELEESFGSLHSNETGGKEDSVIICEPSFCDPASEVLRRCGQEEPLPFLGCYPSRLKESCKKIGEGVYGEVFLCSESASVIKLIPIEGSMEVNGEPQKTFHEIFSEVCVAQELSGLRRGTDNIASTFNEVKAIRCVRGSYPVWLLDLWHDFNDTKGSENDCPDMFQEDQLYIVLELKHGGKDLESFVFSSADQGLAAFKQIALTLAVGERALNFEHRDLHWGNVLLASTKTKTVDFVLNGESKSVLSKGVEVSIIDFTLSRINHPETGSAIFYDLSKDETLFTAQGDYQFEIYRLMKDFCGNKWDCFTPKTNIAWLHYLLDKFCTMVRYKNRTSKAHGHALDKLNEMKDTVLMFNDVVSFVNCSLFNT